MDDDRESERDNTWKVEGVETKRVNRVPQTNAEELIPDRIPNVEARRTSGTLSAW